jgi:hypothetical protein
MYVLSTGCQWRAIPKDPPPKSTVYDYFDLWTYDGFGSMSFTLPPVISQAASINSSLVVVVLLLLCRHPAGVGINGRTRRRFSPDQDA